MKQYGLFDHLFWGHPECTVFADYDNNQNAYRVLCVLSVDKANTFVDVLARYHTG